MFKAIAARLDERGLHRLMDHLLLFGGDLLRVTFDDPQNYKNGTRPIPFAGTSQ
jgi:hypothetical protein